LAIGGVFTPVLAKHTKSFNLVDTLSVGVDRIQRDFEPMQRQVESWRQTQITDAQGASFSCSCQLNPNGLLFHERRNVNRSQRRGSSRSSGAKSL
jgi:hypothetical protein